MRKSTQLLQIDAFLRKIHSMWMADDQLECDEKVSCISALMDMYGVSYKYIFDLEGEYFNKSTDVESVRKLFEYYVNDKSKDDFGKFAEVCMALMDFSGIHSIHVNQAA